MLSTENFPSVVAVKYQHPIGLPYLQRNTQQNSVFVFCTVPNRNTIFMLGISKTSPKFAGRIRSTKLVKNKIKSAVIRKIFDTWLVKNVKLTTETYFTGSPSMKGPTVRMKTNHHEEQLIFQPIITLGSGNVIFILTNHRPLLLGPTCCSQSAGFSERHISTCFNVLSSEPKKELQFFTHWH